MKHGHEGWPDEVLHAQEEHGQGTSISGLLTKVLHTQEEHGQDIYLRVTDWK